MITTKILSLLLLTISLSAYDIDRARANLAHEYVECATYYMIGSGGAKKSNKHEFANKLYNLSEKAMEISTILSNMDVMMARMKLEMEYQSDLMKNDFSNISILTVKYGKKCNKAMEDPSLRLKYWLDKK